MAWTDLTTPRVIVELITNGSFDGNAAGWDFREANGKWAYGSNNVQHTAGSGDGGQIEQGVQVVLNTNYTIGITVGGTTGTIDVTLGADSQTIPAGTGATSFTLTPTTNQGFIISASSDFDGNVSSVSCQPTTGSTWTSIPFPVTDQGTPVGVPIGLLLALTDPDGESGDWTTISNASGTPWVQVPNAV